LNPISLLVSSMSGNRFWDAYWLPTELPADPLNFHADG
jgi:hypothetical protein